jgi:hypothetical protein
VLSAASPQASAKPINSQNWLHSDEQLSSRSSTAHVSYHTASQGNSQLIRGKCQAALLLFWPSDIANVGDKHWLQAAASSTVTEVTVPATVSETADAKLL